MQLSLRTSSKRSGFRSGFLRFPMGFRRFPRFPATFPCVSRSTDSKNGGFLYWFLDVSALSGNLPLRFSMDREHKLPKLIIYPTKRTEKFESVTFPCLNQTGEESLFRFFLALRVEFKRMGESDSVANVARALASSPWQAPAP